ncbi:MAG: hypothetical protein DWQ06_06630 [Calditrichaeota bacterium]|nr:MAG: hypothetical protein DWQ06_06630 [Calditrichota bacterium]
MDKNTVKQIAFEARQKLGEKATPELVEKVVRRTLELMGNNEIATQTKNTFSEKLTGILTVVGNSEKLDSVRSLIKSSHCKIFVEQSFNVRDRQVTHFSIDCSESIASPQEVVKQINQLGSLESHFFKI